ncbi:MAG: vanillate O-demethylase oxidoreductase VanB [Chloroflexi bacterium]|nr:MAG: vanillate O-demethylase oxidoreductase VanB [Chloroflexota bacterium]
METAVSDRIEKQVVLRAVPARVWRALADAQEFGSWFGVELVGAFGPGARLRGRVTHPGHEHITMELEVAQWEPERLLAWRWYPGAPEPGHAYQEEATTLVVFELASVPEGTLLKITESGFDQLSPERRVAAYRENEGGWELQMQAIARHVGQAS